MKAKEFSVIVKSAKCELKGTFTSPFVICNLLNKAAKGDFSKVANCSELDRENLAKVAKVVKGMHGQRYAFDMCLFEKDYKGRFVSLSPFKGEKESLTVDYIDTKEGISVCVLTDGKGREIITDKAGMLVTCTPISLTVSGVFAAFAKVARVELSANEKAAKDAEKAETKAAKEFEKAKKGIISDYNNGLYGESELAARLQELREKYGK